MIAPSDKTRDGKGGVKTIAISSRLVKIRSIEAGAAVILSSRYIE